MWLHGSVAVAIPSRQKKQKCVVLAFVSSVGCDFIIIIIIIIIWESVLGDPGSQQLHVAGWKRASR